MTIGSGVQGIGVNAFGNCPELTDVYCYANNVPKIGSTAFDGSYIEYATLHVPEESIDSYNATEPWSRFGNNVGITTGIDSIVAGEKGDDGILYDLNGRRVNNDGSSIRRKGIYIKNGRKVVVK